jgi:hypothetical protein
MHLTDRVLVQDSDGNLTISQPDGYPVFSLTIK